MTTTTPTAVPSLWQRLVAGFLGTGLLVAIVVGSGIMASRLSPNDVGLQLLENSLATALGLAVLIVVIAPVSGAHFNPVVSIVDLVSRRWRQPLGTVGYLFVQVAGGIAGAILANAMFGIPTVIATSDRVDTGTLIGEVVATAGLILVIFGLGRTGHTSLIAPAVGASHLLRLCSSLPRSSSAVPSGSRSPTCSFPQLRQETEP